MTTCELATRAGLERALAETGSYAEVSRRYGVPASTLKSRAKRLGAQLPQRALVPVALQHEAERSCFRLGEIPQTEWIMERAENARRHELEAVLSGESGQLDLASFSLLVEMDSPLARGDHQRLLYAASLALDYYEERRTPNQREFIRKVAAACQVEESDLRAYCLVLGNEIRYRAKTGAEPLRMLPHLVEANTTAEANKDGWPEASE